MLGTPEIIALVALAVVFFFGPSKLKEFAGAVGEAKAEYLQGKQHSKEVAEDLEEVAEDEE